MSKQPPQNWAMVAALLLVADSMTGGQVAKSCWQAVSWMIPSAGAATYCVSANTGDNGNDGVSPNCWKTSEYADDQIADGDIVEFYAGAYKNIESENNNVTWRMAAGEPACGASFYNRQLDNSRQPRAVILVNGTDTLVEGLRIDADFLNSGKKGVHINADRGTVKGLCYEGLLDGEIPTPHGLRDLARTSRTSRDGGDGHREPVIHLGGEYSIATENYIRYAPQDGIRQDNTARYQEITWNNVARTGYDSIDLDNNCKGQSFRVQNTIVAYNYLGQAVASHGIEHNEDDDPDDTNPTCIVGFWMHHNLVYGHDEAGTAWKGARGVVYENNVNMSSTGEDDGNWDNNLTESCSPENIDGSGAVSRDTTWRNNLVVDNGGGFYQDNRAAQYNNTVINNTRTYYTFNGDACENRTGLGGKGTTLAVLANNIVFNNQPQNLVLTRDNINGGAPMAGGNIYNANGVWEDLDDGRFFSLADWQNHVGWETNSITIDDITDVLIDQTVPNNFTMGEHRAWAGTGPGTDDQNDDWNKTEVDFLEVLSRFKLKPEYETGGNAVGKIESKTSDTTFNVGYAGTRAIGFCWDTSNVNIPRPVIRLRGSDYTVDSCDYDARTMVISPACSACVAGDEFDIVYASGKTSRMRGAHDYWIPDAGPTEPPPDAADVIGTIAQSSDDAEETTTGTVSLTSGYLDIPVNPSLGPADEHQTIGLRFTGLGEIPQGAEIFSARIEFTARGTSSGATEALISTGLTDLGTFTDTAFDITSRPKYGPAVSWIPEGWSTVDGKYLSADFSSVAQLSVNNPAWLDTMIVYLESPGGTIDRRVAWTFDSDSLKSARLLIDYEASPVITVPAAAQCYKDEQCQAVIRGVDEDGVTCSTMFQSEGSLGAPDANCDSIWTYTPTAAGSEVVNFSATSTTTAKVVYDNTTVTTYDPTTGSGVFPVATGLCDAVENGATGAVVVDGASLGLDVETYAGLCFDAIPVGNAAVVTNATISMTADADLGGSIQYGVYCQAADDAPVFGTGTGDISNRSRTAGGVNWSPTAWTADEVQTTPQLRRVVHEVTSRAGWAHGNRLACIIEGPQDTGAPRSAYSIEAGTPATISLEWSPKVTLSSSPVDEADTGSEGGEGVDTTGPIEITDGN